MGDVIGFGRHRRQRHGRWRLPPYAPFALIVGMAAVGVARVGPSESTPRRG